MKVTLENKNSKKVFDQFTESMATNLRKWHNVKPAKRTAFLLFHDEDAGEYVAYILGNKRAKYPTATALKGLGEAMIQRADLLGWIKANVNYAERELKKRGIHGKD